MYKSTVVREKEKRIKCTAKRLCFAISIMASSLIIPVFLLLIKRRFLKTKSSSTGELLSPLITQEQSENQILNYITKDQVSPPLTMGPRRLHYQFSTVLPQAHLTLVSILQGLVFGILLINIPMPLKLQILSLDFLLQQYLYLPYLISICLILVIWNQYIHTVIFLAWPFSVFQSSLIFLLTLAEIVAVREITSLPNWIFGLGLIAIIGGFIRLNNLRLLTKETFEPTALTAFIASRKSQVRDGVLYIFLGIIVMLLSLEYNRLLTLIPFATWLILALLLSFIFSVMLLDRISRRPFINQIANRSDIELSLKGVLQYKDIKQ